MGRKPRVDRTPEEKWQIVQEGMKSGNVSETCRRHGIAPDALLPLERRSGAGSEGSAWGEERCGRGNRERSAHPAAGTNARPQITGN